MGSISSCYVGCVDNSDGFDLRSKNITERQQCQIIEQLRESHHKTSPNKINRRNSVTKILPLEVDRITEKKSRNEILSTNPITNDRVTEKIFSRGISVAEELQLKQALTHPTIVKFLRSFMYAQCNCDLLDFFLDVVEIRGLHRELKYSGNFAL